MSTKQDATAQDSRATPPESRLFGRLLAALRSGLAADRELTVQDVRLAVGKLRRFVREHARTQGANAQPKIELEFESIAKRCALKMTDAVNP